MSTVAPLVSDRISAIEQLCNQFHVRRLELFGSATNGRFDEQSSDLDFLVEFDPLVPADRADAYFGLLAALQDMFDRSIDLVETEALSNPYFKHSLNQQRTLLYAA